MVLQQVGYLIGTVISVANLSTPKAGDFLRSKKKGVEQLSSGVRRYRLIPLTEPYVRASYTAMHTSYHFNL